MIKFISNFTSDIFKSFFSLIRSILVSFFVIILIIIVFTGFGLLANTESAQHISNYQEEIIRDNNGESKILLVNLNGIIVNQSTNNFFKDTSGIITPDKFDKIYKNVSNDPLIKAIIFDINSPGGSPVASDRIYELTQDFKNKYGIPIIFLFGDVAASGGYYIASNADHIVSNPATITGSIGVILESYNLQGLYEKLGINKQIFKQGEYKDILNESREVTEVERDILNSISYDTYQLFIQRVAEGRNMSETQVQQIANGKIYSGRQAKNINLVDSLGNLDEAIYQAKSLANIDNYKVVKYNTKGIMEELFNQIKNNFDPFKIITAFPKSKLTLN